MTRGLSGIVLAGGKSRRAGFDKARALLDGRTLLSIVVERLAPICDEVIVALGPSGRSPFSDLPVRYVYDTFPEYGPLAGIQAGLSAADNTHCLVVACDMPFLSPGLLAYMADLPRDYQALVSRIGERVQPLHAIYARSALSHIEDALARGEKRIAEVLACLDVKTLGEGDVAAYDPEFRSFQNLNTGDDLSRAGVIIERHGGIVR